MDPSLDKPMVEKIKSPLTCWNNKGKALITGASAGLGASYALFCAKLGFTPVLVARRKEKLDELTVKISKETGIKSEIIVADLTQSQDVSALEEYITKCPNLDILINNAGFGTIGSWLDVPFNKSLDMLQVHVTAVVHLCHACLAGMLKRKRGAIINVASLNAFLFAPGNIMYNSTKAFLAAFTRNLAFEVMDDPILVQCLCPGFTKTEFHEVGDFKNFDRKSILNWMWMDSDDVIIQSFNHLKKKPVIFIPGFKNRLLRWLYDNTFLSTIFVNFYHKQQKKTIRETLKK